jgi:predicted NACHT family NTPase
MAAHIVVAVFSATLPPDKFHAIAAWSKDNPALVALFGVVLGGFLTTIGWPFLKAVVTRRIEAIQSKFGGKRLEHAYLDSVIDSHRFLPSLPSTLVPVTEGAHRQELDNIYVSLTISEREANPTGVELGEALCNHRRLVILGDPGSGKTTMLRFLTLTFARALRGKSTSREPTRAKSEETRILEARDRVKNSYKIVDRPLPVFIYLNRLRNVAEWPKERSILEAIYEDWHPVNTTRELQRQFIEEKVAAGKCIFFFDAFDELGSQEARELIAVKLGEFCTQVPEGNRFVVSSRIVGYNRQLDRYGFTTLTVQRLSWDLTKRLVGNWYKSLGQPDLEPLLLDALKGNPRLNDLATNPMLLSLIVLVQYVLPLIPDKRHVLYEECLKILLERRYAPPRIQREFNELLPADEATSIVSSIALKMHQEKLREIPRPRLEDAIIPEILQGMPLSKAARVPPKDILANIESRSQLLTERGINDRGEPVMAFSHLTFQEYLVSKEFWLDMSARGKKLVMTDLVGRYSADPDWWGEVALLFAAQLESKDQQPFFDLLRPQANLI